MARDPHAARKLLGTNVRRLRDAKVLTQAQLAEKMGVRLPWISEVENGKTNASIDNIQRLASALGVHVSDLFKE